MVKYTHTVRVAIRVSDGESGEESVHEWTNWKDNPKGGFGKDLSFDTANSLLCCLSGIGILHGLEILAETVILEPGIIWPYKPSQEVDAAAENFVKAAQSLIDALKIKEEQ